MVQKMGLRIVTTMQGVSVTSILNKIASYLAHSLAKICTIAVPHIEFTADKYTYIIIMVPCNTVWHGMRKEHIP